MYTIIKDDSWHVSPAESKELQLLLLLLFIPFGAQLILRSQVPWGNPEVP